MTKLYESLAALKDAEARKNKAHEAVADSKAELVADITKALNKLTGRRFVTDGTNLYSKTDKFTVYLYWSRTGNKLEVSKEMPNTSKRSDYSSSGAYASNCYPISRTIFTGKVIKTLTAEKIAKAMAKTLKEIK